MKNLFFISLLSISFFLNSCSEKVSDPVSNNEPAKFPVSECSIWGIDLWFTDTCSYNFVTSFLSNFDSVKIQQTFLGGVFFLHADSGDANYWYDYFSNDSTIVYMFSVNSNPDSLILKFVLSGKKSIEVEKQRFLSIKGMHIIEIQTQPKYVIVKVPENTEMEWAELFRQYGFVTQTLVIGVCTNS